MLPFTAGASLGICEAQLALIQNFEFFFISEFKCICTMLGLAVGLTHAGILFGLILSSNLVCICINT